MKYVTIYKNIYYNEPYINHVTLQWGGAGLSKRHKLSSRRGGGFVSRHVTKGTFSRYQKL